MRVLKGVDRGEMMKHTLVTERRGRYCEDIHVVRHFNEREKHEHCSEEGNEGTQNGMYVSHTERNHTTGHANLDSGIAQTDVPPICSFLLDGWSIHRPRWRNVEADGLCGVMKTSDECLVVCSSSKPAVFVESVAGLTT